MNREETLAILSARAARRARKGLRYGNGRTLHDWQRKQAFGLRPQDKWPAAELDFRFIETDGDQVLHRVQAIGDAGPVGGRRCIACCPRCGTWVCAGHYGQHKRAFHADEVATERERALYAEGQP